MLALVSEPRARVGLQDSQTVYAIVSERDLVHLFTIIEKRSKPISSNALLRIGVKKIVDVRTTPIGQQRSCFHTLFLQEAPGARVKALSRVLRRLHERSLTWTDFNRMYRTKRWPRIVKEIADTHAADELANIVSGIIIGVLSPKTLFNTLRAELSRLGVLNTIELVKKFSDYVEELNEEEEYTITDVEDILEKRLRITPVSHTLSDDKSFVEPMRKKRDWEPVQLFSRSSREQYADTYADSLPSLSGESTGTHHVQMKHDENVETTSHPRGIRMGTPSMTSKYDLPEIDETVDWRDLGRRVITANEESFLEFKRELRLEDDEFMVRFIKCFIGMVNLCQRENKRGLIVIGNGLEEGQDFHDDAVYQEIIEGYIRPKPRFVFRPNPNAGVNLGVLIIHPVGGRPFVANRSILPRGSDKTIEDGQCFLREGTRTVLLDEDGRFDLMADLTRKYG